MGSPFTDNARYAKLRLIGRKHNRHIPDGRFRKVIALSTASCVSGKILGYMPSMKQCIKVLPIQFSLVGRYERTMIAQNYIVKIMGNVGGVADVIFCFAVFCQRYLSGPKTKFPNFLFSCACRHKSAGHVRSDCPIVIDIGIITETNRILAVNALLIDSADANIGNVTQFNRFQEQILQ